MKTRKWLAVASGALALGTFSILGAAYVAPPAHAQPLAQARPTHSVAGPQVDSSFQLCLWENTTECIVSNGAGNQVTIEPKDYADFHVVNTDGGWKQMENAGGNCLREYADNTVGLALGGCDYNTSAEWWYPSSDSNGRYTYLNFKYPGTYLGTFGTNSGRDVYAETPRSGFYSGWIPL